MDVKGKHFLVVGLGVSGQAAAVLLATKGARVTAIDQSEESKMKRKARRKKLTGIHMQFGVKHPPAGRFDAAILSPGLDPRHGLGREAMNLDIPVYGELELGSWFCQCPILAITGTNGKTTTTELVSRILRANRRKTLAAGNIGLAISEAALRSDGLDFLTVEVSSFQLETIERFRPRVSVMMNITPDHLDRYDTMDDYVKAKAALWKNQCGNDTAVVNADSEKLLAGLGFTPPVRPIRYSITGEKADFWFDGSIIRGSAMEEAGLGDARLGLTRLRGPHNAENVMASLAVAHALGLSLPRSWKAVCDYQPLAHRLETVGTIGGIEFVNDSKATNLDAMEKAIRSFQRPVILIAGGKDKGFDFSGLTPLIRERVKACVLIGEMRQRIFEAWKDAATCVFSDSLEEAVNLTVRLGRRGDVVLLSPGCSSYDMFENYEERGNVFRRSVEQLAQQPARN